MLTAVVISGSKVIGGSEGSLSAVTTNGGRVITASVFWSPSPIPP